MVRTDLDINFPILFKVMQSSRPELFCKKGVLRNFAKFTGKHRCQSLFFDKVVGEILAQVFSSEFCKIAESTFFHRTPLVAASVCTYLWH